ncbi:lysophosphatidylcholine acyltransferase isoform X2 [Lutzomyia longipalpis]|uniref:lysophosphatidylcholine acyltransferase isoform X2 n=2 Tax=Lutzomyia longipalpis TaxID=7200 RepID=UPI0024832EC0|nr:lysophosphatidylcholine acyltransferase isoform X2 [Lutzomyia longipalpis]XP_055685446.1 lysophosphatidylcholine acyltransferase isoform X2 [Lutzomyia longipalpis]
MTENHQFSSQDTSVVGIEKHQRNTNMDPKSENLHLINPFVHKMELIDPLDKVKTAVFTVLLLPFRVFVICLLLLLAWFLACIGLYGLTEEDLRSRPMKGWRRFLKNIICLVGRCSYLAGGMSIRVIGSRCSRDEAPILVAAPHTSFLDSVIVYVTNMSSVIVRKESMDNYVGKLINYTQPIYVWRDDPNSRQNTIKAIKERANSPEDWPQIIIFPEGTCTNRSCLITFKNGAFYPGVPIQPVCIRYPNVRDTVTWTWDGPGVLKLLWLTLTQVHSACEIEFLPIYVPSQEEKENAKLYAHNVRNVMSKALGLPISDYTYDDCKILTRAKEMNLPFASSIIDIEKLRKSIGLKETNIDEKPVMLPKYELDYIEFCQKLEIPQNHSHARKLFSLFDPESSGVIDFRNYLLCTQFLMKLNQPLIDLVKSAFEIYQNDSNGVSCEIFYFIIRHTLGVPDEVIHLIYSQIAKQSSQELITFDDFAKYARGKAEFSKIFTENVDSCEKLKQV